MARPATCRSGHCAGDDAGLACRFAGLAGIRLCAHAPLIERASNRDDAPPVHDELARGERLARLAAIAGRHGPVEATCLRQSLLVYGLLRRRGSAPELKIGVRREDTAIAAHAWVELAGVSLDQTPRNHSPFPDARPHGDLPA